MRFLFLCSFKSIRIIFSLARSSYIVSLDTYLSVLYSVMRAVGFLPRFRLLKLGEQSFYFVYFNL